MGTEMLPYQHPDEPREVDALRLELEAEADFDARHADALHDGADPWPVTLRDVGATP